jgi:nitrous oxidase accessory protein
VALLAAILSGGGEAVLASGVSDWRQDKSPLGALQAKVAALRPGETLRLEPGAYEGPIAIRTAGVAIVGGPGVRIVGQGSGTVIVVEADDVVLDGLAITGSGTSYDQIDAGLAIRDAKGVTAKNLTIDNCLFGIDVSNARDVLLEGNKISSKDLSLGLRGDAIRLWATKDAVIRGNHWADARDAVSWYSERVRFEDNEATRSRYSIHSMYTKSLLIKGNRFYENSVGIFIMYGEGTTVLDNVVRHSVGATGIGLGMKETSSLYARGNTFVYCATGILVDNSPWEPTARDWFQENHIALNGTGVMFSSGREGNLFEGNTFQGNMVDVDTESRSPSRSLWKGNRWDAYDGFDRDADGVGDTPFRVLKYSDLMASSHPMAGFFEATPVAALVALVERLLPLTEPVVLLSDAAPRFGRPAAPVAP